MISLPAALVKFGFYLLYHQFAWTYDAVAWSVSFGQWSAWRRLALNYARPGRTLELAYGTGGLFVDMLNQGQQPVGIDLSPYMAAIARRRVLQHGFPLRLSQASALNLPFPDQQFDTVIATFPTNYIFKPETLETVHRVLRPQGRLVIVLAGELRGPWPIRPFIDWLYYITNQKGDPVAKPIRRIERQRFAARWERADVDGASARLIICDKL